MIKSDVFVANYLSKEVVVGVLMQWRDCNVMMVSISVTYYGQRQAMKG